MLNAADLPLLRDSVILANAGHFPAGRRVHIIARGHMFNLAGTRPLGNSIESMDLGFALQARCLEAVANHSVDATSCVVPVPGRIDAAIANSYLDRKYPPVPAV